MNKLIRYTLLLCAVALIAATGATAGSLITGANVKNGSLTGKDVKNKSLTKSDFKGSVRGRAGATGPQGVPGLQGPKGNAGTNGASGANGTDGVVVIQRTTGSATPSDDAGDPASTTLSNPGFSNPAANTDNLFFARVTFTPPAVCTLAPGDNETFGFGGEVDTDPVFGGGGPFTAGAPASVVQLGVANATALGAGSHTLTLHFSTNCTGSGQHGSITNIKLDTAAIG
jgi:hypothetical protein